MKNEKGRTEAKKKGRKEERKRKERKERVEEFSVSAPRIGCPTRQ